MDFEKYLDKMSNQTEYADELVVTAMSHYLRCRINVVSSPPNLIRVNDCLKRYAPPGQLNAAQLWLGHRHENHYVSLVSIAYIRVVNGYYAKSYRTTIWHPEMLKLFPC